MVHFDHFGPWILVSFLIIGPRWAPRVTGVGRHGSKWLTRIGLIIGVPRSSRMARSCWVTVVTLAIATSVHAFVPQGTGVAARTVPRLAKGATRRRSVAIAPKMNLGQSLLVPAAMHLADAAVSQSDQTTAVFLCIALAGALAAAAAAQNKGGAGFDAKAPAITIFEHCRCDRGAENTEYTGDASGGIDDEMCVKVKLESVPISYERAATQLAESISYRAKGIDGAYTAEKDLSIYKKPGFSAGY